MSPEEKTSKNKAKKKIKGKKYLKKESSSTEGTKLSTKLGKRPTSDSKTSDKAKQNATTVPMESHDQLIAVEIKKTDVETTKADETNESDDSSRKIEPTKTAIEGVEIPGLGQNTGTSSEKKDVKAKAHELASTASPVKKSLSKAVKNANEPKLSADPAKKDVGNTKKVENTRSQETAEDAEQDVDDDQEEEDDGHKLAVAKEKSAGEGKKRAGKSQKIIDPKNEENAEPEEQDSKAGLEEGDSGKKIPVTTADETQKVANSENKHSDNLISDDAEESDVHKEVVLKGLPDDDKNENTDSETLPGMNTDSEEKGIETLSKQINDDSF